MDTRFIKKSLHSEKKISIDSEISLEKKGIDIIIQKLFCRTTLGFVNVVEVTVVIKPYITVTKVLNFYGC